jgi:hypothetical protein
MWFLQCVGWQALITALLVVIAREKNCPYAITTTPDGQVRG